MAQDFEQIISLLREMNNINNSSTEALDRLLRGISSKIDSSLSNQVSKELIKTYIDELARTMSVKYDTTINRFTDIEQALKAIYAIQKDQVKSSDINEIFNAFSTKMAEFYTDIRQQRALLSSVEAKLSNLANDETAKDDILRSMTLMRTDFENLNGAYKDVISEINSGIRSLLTSFVDTDQTQINKEIKSSVDSIGYYINDIISTLNTIKETGDNLEFILNGVSTKEGLKETNELVGILIEKTGNISDKIDLLPDKYDSKSLKESSDLIIDKLGATAKDIDMLKITEIIEDLYSETENVKMALGSIAENIDYRSDIEAINNFFEKLYIRLDELSSNVETSNVKGDVYDVLTKIDFIKDEFSTIKSIISDLEDSIKTKIQTAIDEFSEKTDIQEIAEAVENLFNSVPTKNDVEELKEFFIEKCKNLSTKDDVDSLKGSIDNINYSEEFSRLYAKTEAIEDMLSKSDIDDPAKEIIENLQTKADQVTVVNLLNKVDTLVDSVEKIDSVSQESFKDFISDVFSKIDEIKDFLEHNSRLWANNISNGIEDAVSAKQNITNIEDAKVFVSELKPTLIKIISEIQVSSDIAFENKNLLNKILQKIESSDENTEIEKKISNVESHLISISDFMKNELRVNEDNIKSAISEIRSVIKNNKNDFIQILKNESKNSDVISEYIESIKELFENSGVNIDENIKTKLDEVEKSLNLYIESTRQAYSDIAGKISEYEKLFAGMSGNEEISSYTEELASIKNRISELGGSFTNGSSSDVAVFVSNKLVELSDNIEDLISDVQNGLQQGFVYNSQLIEEKSQVLLDVIRHERHSSTQDIGLFEKLTVADARLTDINQELGLVNTDIASSINSINENLSDKISEIRESLLNISQDSDQISSLRTEVDDLALTIKSYIDNDKSTSNALSVEVDSLYEKMSSNITEISTDLKDFILSDIDSVIIKIGDIKEELEALLKGIVPPDPNEMKEFHQFVKEISDFRASQKTFFDDIKKSVEVSRDELKSIVQVALNDSEIIKEVQKMASSFKTGVSIPVKENDSLGPNLYDNAFFESDDVKNALNTLFEDFESRISELSGQNNEVMTVLTGIKTKLSNAQITETDEGLEIKTSSGFDFERAFEFIIESVEGIGNKVKDLIQGSPRRDLAQELMENTDAFDSSEWLEKAKYYLGKDDALNILKEISLKLDAHYGFKSDELETLSSDVEAINLDLSSSSEQLEQVNEQLSAVSSKLDEYFSSGNKSFVEEINNSLFDVTVLLNEKFGGIAKNDEKITSMLEMLNHKIDVIANDTTGIEELEDVRDLIISQQEYIEKLNPGEKTEVLKGCLDDLLNQITDMSDKSDKSTVDVKSTLKDMKDSIMSAVVNIFSQVSFIEESEDIKDFVEEKTDSINKNLELVTEKLKLIASAEDSDSTYVYSMQDIETDLAKLRLALNQLQENGIAVSSDEEVTTYLSKINETIDSLSQEELKSLKTDISELRSQTQEILKVSDESYSDLKDEISLKVDNMTRILEQSSLSDKVMRQALIYIGEWIDSTSESINKISQNSEEIAQLKNLLELVNNSIPEGALSSIEEGFELQQQRLSYFEKQISKIGNLESRFEQQEERIDRLEMNIDKILSAIENIDDAGISRKIEKLEKQIGKLSINIDKLASYVD